MMVYSSVLDLRWSSGQSLAGQSLAEDIPPSTTKFAHRALYHDKRIVCGGFHGDGKISQALALS